MRTFLISFLSFLVPGFAASARADDPAFVPLFDGRDLAGWHPVNGAPDTFSVRDGMIVLTGAPKCFLRTARQYENFVFECDWQLMTDGGNSGVLIWTTGLPAPGAPFPKAIEVQVLDRGFEKEHPQGVNRSYTTQGDIFPIRGASMLPAGRTSSSGKRSFPGENRTRPAPEWNHYRLECNRGEIHLAVNGREVTVAKDCNPRKGFIALESETGEVHFKNLRIEELPSSQTLPEQTAEADPGFEPLFDGAGFGGWNLTPAGKRVWTEKENIFSAKDRVAGALIETRNDSRNMDIWTEKSYRDFELMVDWRLPKPATMKSRATFTAGGLYVRNEKGEVVRQDILDAGDSGVYLRGEVIDQVNIWCQPMGSGDINDLHKDPKLPVEIRRALQPGLNADAPFGRWNRFLITLRADRLTVLLNGRKVIDNAILPGVPREGPIGLQYHHDAVEFTNLYIRELK